MCNWQNQTDEELIQELRQGKKEITDFLINKYKNLVRKKANALFLIGGDTDDLVQEGMIGLFKAIRDFDGEKETGFYHFAELCITRQMYTAIEASNRKKHAPLNGYISFDQKDEDGAFHSALLSLEELSPEELVISKEQIEEMYERAEQKLSNMEKKVFSYYLNGYNYHQIAEAMQKPEKSIDNALHRIKRKLQETS